MLTVLRDEVHHFYQPLIHPRLLASRDHQARIDPDHPELFHNGGLSFVIHPDIPEPSNCAGLVRVSFFDRQKQNVLLYSYDLYEKKPNTPGYPQKAKAPLSRPTDCRLKGCEYGSFTVIPSSIFTYSIAPRETIRKRARTREDEEDSIPTRSTSSLSPTRPPKRLRPLDSYPPSSSAGPSSHQSRISEDEYPSSYVDTLESLSSPALSIITPSDDSSDDSSDDPSDSPNADPNSEPIDDDPDFRAQLYFQFKVERKLEDVVAYVLGSFDPITISHTDISIDVDLCSLYATVKEEMAMKEQVVSPFWSVDEDFGEQPLGCCLESSEW